MTSLAKQYGDQHSHVGTIDHLCQRAFVLSWLLKI